MHFSTCKVQAVVCDQATTNVRALQLLGATLDPQGGDDSHCVEAEGQKIPIVFDVPHLIKSIRNNFHKYGLKVSTTLKASNT